MMKQNAIQTCDHCDMLWVGTAPARHQPDCPTRLDTDETKSIGCRWCGEFFIPQNPDQRFCDQGCVNAYYAVS